MALPLVSASLAIALALAPARKPGPVERYVELVAAYARGDRAVAVAGVGALSQETIRLGLDRLQAEHPFLSRAAVMLHTDRRLLERQERDAAESEPACASEQTRPAWEAAQLLMLAPSTTDFARRWLIAMTLHDRYAGCVVDAFRWSDAAARAFAGDAEVLLARGTLYESVAALETPPSPLAASAGSRARQQAMTAAAGRDSRLAEAQRALERALVADPSVELARLRLGRVLWRLGKGKAARSALEKVTAESRDAAVLHLAHLFLARVHQDAGDADAALREFRAAHALQPTSQPAAMGLSDALQLAGDTEGARAVVEGSLAVAGRRPAPQSFWEYTFGDPRQGIELLDRLREETRE